MANNKPKITGLSFNLFAIVGLLVILPITTATISNLAGETSTSYQSVNDMVDMNDPTLCGGFGSDPFGEDSLLDWVDKGENVTKFYMDNNPTSQVTDYETMYDENSGFYGDYMLYGCLNQIPHYRNSDQFFVAHDNHYTLRLFEPNHAGYIGYSGDDFTFRINEEYFQFIPDDKDISKFKITMVNTDESFNCAIDSLWQNIEYKSDITFGHDIFDSWSINGYEFDRSNKYEVDFLPNNAVPNNANGTGQPYGNICHHKITLEYELTPFEAREFKERFNNDFDNLTMTVRIYDIDAVYNSSTVVNGYVQSMPVPFTGNWKVGFLLEVAYVDLVQTNFILNGGALISGVALFGLAISSTPYWNPVVNFFKPK
jgi:hypothetical protein